MRTRLMQYLDRLCAIPSPTRDRVAVASAMNEMVDMTVQPGYGVTYVEPWNRGLLIGYGDRNPKMLVVCHADTVQQKWDADALKNAKPSARDGMYGLEGVQLGLDDKAGLAIAACALGGCYRKALPTALLVSPNEEEGDAWTYEVMRDGRVGMPESAIILDREGHEDAVCAYGYSPKTETASPEFVAELSATMRMPWPWVRCNSNRSPHLMILHEYGVRNVVNISTGVYNIHSGYDELHIPTALELVKGLRRLFRAGIWWEG